MHKIIYSISIASFLIGCSTNPAIEPDEKAETDPLLREQKLPYTTVAEAFLTPLTPEHNIDSPASWTASNGTTWLIATAKATDKLVVYDGDNGEMLSSIGSSGTKTGQFKRPNGIFVSDDLMFVVERDNRRIQVLTLPEMKPLGLFGSTELTAPYGLWVEKSGEGYQVLVSDAYMDGEAVPPLAELGRRYKRFLISTAGGFRAKYLGDFGNTDAEGAIRIPESIWGDGVRGVLLLSEEDQLAGTYLKVYDRNYRYTGKTVGRGLFKAQAEGIALWQCSDGSGYWIATDQFKDRSLFHVFDRSDFSHKGAFAGNTTANTDGVWLNQAPSGKFPDGVFYAVHDDQGVAAFDWRDIATALGLKARCD